MIEGKVTLTDSKVRRRQDEGTKTDGMREHTPKTSD